MIPALALLTAAIAGADPGALSLGGERRIVVQGRIVSESGEGMAGWPVQLIGTQRYIELNRRTSGGAEGTIARTVTDGSGYYSIDVPRDRHYQFWFLRFADPAQLDPVRYQTPEDDEITALVRRGRVASVQTTIRLQPQWPEIERRIAEAGGPSSEKGKILLSLGLPEKTVPAGSAGAGPGEEWWYFTRGIVYTFRGGGPAVTRRFEPVAPPVVGAGR